MIILLIFGIIIGISIYRCIFFHSKKFKKIKNEASDLTSEFNELNAYADSLSVNILGGQSGQEIVGHISNTSRWNYKHNGLFSMKTHKQVYNCSSSIVKNAQLDGFKYLCKYFNISIDEEHRDLANNMLNNFNSYYESRELLSKKQNNLFNSIKNELPFLIKIFKESLYKNLGLTQLDLRSIIFPSYIFTYTSSGGNSSLSYTLTLTTENLQKLINWLDGKIKYKKSAQYQRIIMTARFRNKIKERDNYTCKKCGVSIEQEPTLLLEIDHIVPISKGGLSIEENLQCLCWKCNRSKGAK